MTPLHTWVTPTNRPEHPNTCWAWLDTTDRVCGTETDAADHLCAQHRAVAERRRDKARAKAAAADQRREARR